MHSATQCYHSIGSEAVHHSGLINQWIMKLRHPNIRMNRRDRESEHGLITQFFRSKGHQHDRYKKRYQTVTEAVGMKVLLRGDSVAASSRQKTKT
jgi:hypothetical protein